ncbi:uncharacterized protein LOC117173347 [Belonocnema kinseyi]|uniref:uncharacterized protein LOC117173347 n=1 Tax=Belonocnema kinseyi TaxID=2817044 RepID=UPI00143D075D|nr:uncharacterized protein LOC117173347 [Belonocnema kinseyi]
MRGIERMVLTKNSYSLTWSFMFMMVFCFAGCAAGSCLSYGHSCWGAHGKRSGIGGPNNLRPLLIPEQNGENNRNFETPSLRDRWLISRLIGKRHQFPNPGKYRVRLYDTLKSRGMPHDWDKNDSMASKEDIIRDNTEKVFKNKESEEESNESESFPRELTGNFDEESAEIILLPRHGVTKDNAGQFRFIKIKTNADDNLK